MRPAGSSAARLHQFGDQAEGLQQSFLMLDDTHHASRTGAIRAIAGISCKR
jgi:hypothetical protein